MTQFSSNGISFSDELMHCPYDGTKARSISLDIDGDVAMVSYACGTSHEIRSDNLPRLYQSDGCVRNELVIIRDHTTPGLQTALDAAQAQIADLQGVIKKNSDELSRALATIDSQKSQIAELERRLEQPVGFKVSFGQPH